MSIIKTPLRYPGGKQRLTPFIIEILIENDLLNGEYVEPYAGGAGVGIELLLGRKVKHIHLNDSNIGIYAFWYSVLYHNEALCRMIASASLTVEEWKKRREIVRNPIGVDYLELGFSIFYLNRCNRSGVLSGGLIGGLNQNGEWKMDARFSRNDLIRKIESIALYKDSITIHNCDAENYIRNHITTLPEKTLIYLDPPYYEKSSNLYLDTYLKDDHSRLSSTIQKEIKHKWILSYDSAIEILNLYKNRKHFIYELQYNASKVYKGSEVFVFCDDLRIPKNSQLKYIDIAINNILSNIDLIES